MVSKWKVAVSAVLLSCAAARATTFINDDFSKFADGNLVGQNGYTQLGTISTLPLQVSGGKVIYPGGQNADNQDAYKNLGTVIAPPASGTTSVFYGLSLNVSAASTAASPSYFAALYTGADASGFANERLTVKDNAGTYVLGARVTGQGGSPYGFGTTGLNYGTTYNVVVEADLAASGADTVEIYVNPKHSDPTLETPYMSTTIGTGTPPTGAGSFVISQFGSATTANPNALQIGSATVADTFAEAAAISAPEPTAAGLLAFALTGLLARRGRVRA